MIDRRAVFTTCGAGLLTLLGMWLSACAGPAKPVEGEPALPRWSQGRMEVLPDKWHERGEWTGSGTCVECHEMEISDFAEASHHRLLEVEGVGWGCEACHGPAEHHIAADSSKEIDSFDRMSTAAVAARCSRCHFEDLRRMDAAGLHSAAAANNCSWCHAVHPATIQGFPSDPGPYTVADCGACHAEAMEVHLSSKHAAMSSGCEACHAGAENHLLSGGAPGTIVKPGGAGYEQMCQQCHQNDHGLQRWESGAHASAGLGCLDCHHVLERAGHPVFADEAAACGECHPAAAAEFQLPSHHPIGDGEVSCVSCHDVHAGEGMFGARKMGVRCDECHPQYAGPFAFEHEADRFDGCGACHAAHGSANRRMLKILPVRNMCLQCHPSIPSFHNTGEPVFKNCINCHTEIHGSHLDRTFFR